LELTVHLVERARRGFVDNRGAHRFAASDTLQAALPHQRLRRASRNIEPFPLRLAPNLADPIDREILGKGPYGLVLEVFIVLGSPATRAPSTSVFFIQSSGVRAKQPIFWESEITAAQRGGYPRNPLSHPLSLGPHLREKHGRCLARQALS